MKKPTPKNPKSRWSSSTQERIFCQKLIRALRSTKEAPSQPLKAMAIKDAADSALALTAKGQTRWSRAILFSRWQKRKSCLKGGGKLRGWFSGRTRVGKAGSGLDPRRRGKKVTERLRVLSRLVPGGRKLSEPMLLEEAADYVAALETQVKTMRTLAELLSSTIQSPHHAESWRLFCFFFLIILRGIC